MELAGALAGLRLEGADPDRLLEVIGAAERLASWAAAVQLAAVGELTRCRERAGDGEFVADEVAVELRASRAAAARRVALAADLERLPATAAALAAGQIDVGKARAVADAVRVLDADRVAAVEAVGAARAAEVTVGQLQAWLARRVLAADPAGADRRHEAAVADRRVAVTPMPDGMAELWALLPADAAAGAYRAVDDLARSTGAPDDPRSMDQRRADALADMLAGGRGPADTQIQVTVPLATLAGAADLPGELPGHGPIPASMARRLAADGVWRWLRTDLAGVVCDAGRRSYRPPPALAALVRGRDQTCRFPGCRHPAGRADLDHTVPYPAGPTGRDNLGTMCRHQQRLVESMLVAWMRRRSIGRGSATSRG
jgi:Domain of unknown function (DUF222)